MTGPSSSTTVTPVTPSRRVLRDVKNCNQTPRSNNKKKYDETPTKLKSKKLDDDTSKVIFKDDEKVELEKEALQPVVNITKEDKDLEGTETENNNNDEKAELFRYVCLNRCGEDLDGDMAEDGIDVWSINDFDYVRDLGTGGTASVYCAKEKQSGYHVALKVQKAGTDGICEIDIHENLQHPSIVKMIDYFFSDEPFIQQPKKETDNGGLESEHENESDYDDYDEDHKPKQYLFMILELCDRSLFDVIRDAESGYLSEVDAAPYLRNAIEALEYLHNKDIIHCDCKSLNFLLSQNGQELKLADFGMTVQNDEKQVVGGSPMYMAPEHLMAWRHMTDNFDHRTDIYSLGVIFFETLVGFLPYEVIQDDGDSILAELLVDSDDDDDDDGLSFRNPVLDLRKLDDQTDDEPFYIPPPIFPEFISTEAQDLISRLMDPIPENRISLVEAKDHAWFQKHAMF